MNVQRDANAKRGRTKYKPIAKNYCNINLGRQALKLLSECKPLPLVVMTPL
jgi:hypothetical protein